MAVTSTKALDQLKKAANYSKLAMHRNGPYSYKKGQGALLKVLYKFGDGSLKRKKLAKMLRWEPEEVKRVVKKAKKNGYVTVTKAKDKLEVSLTAEGKAIMDKRFAAEDKAADEVLAGLTADQVDTLYELTGKIIDTCKAMGIDYDVIRKRPEKGMHTDHWHEEHRHEDRVAEVDNPEASEEPIAD